MNKKFNSIRYSNDFPMNEIEEIRISKVLRLIGSNKSIVDLGCGDGFIMDRIKSANNSVVGVEVAESAIKKSRAKGYKVYDLLLEGNWSNKINEKFDVVFAGEIIEHIFDTDNFLQNIRKILKNNGRLIVTTPNLTSLGRRIMFFFGKSPLIEVTARSYDAGHIRYFTGKTLTDLLVQNGYKIELIESTVINFSNKGKFYFRKLADLFPAFGNNIIVGARK